jgi:hypothetical protein
MKPKNINKIAGKMSLSTLLLFLLLGCAAQTKVIEDPQRKEDLQYFQKRLIPKYSNDQWTMIPFFRNKELWYEEIKSPDQTVYTSLWDDYSKNQYHAEISDFKNEIIMNDDRFVFAAQFGPLGGLWSYVTYYGYFSNDSLIEIAQSTFSHNRFVFKSRGIVKDKAMFIQALIGAKSKVDSFFIDSLYFEKIPTFFKNAKLDSSLSKDTALVNTLATADTLRIPKIATRNNVKCNELSGIIVYKSANQKHQFYYPGNPIVEDTCKSVLEINSIVNHALDSLVLWHRTY